jgi:hypothetical protein
MSTLRQKVLSFSALSEATTRISSLEQDLGKALRAVAASKKANEALQLASEKEMLQKKLQSQEEEFRFQNRTLMGELANVRSTLVFRNTQCWSNRATNPIIIYSRGETIIVFDLSHFDRFRRPLSLASLQKK